MATVAGVKIKIKTQKSRDPLFFDEKYTGGEPEWDTEAAKSWDSDQFDHLLRQSFYYYNYYYSQKSCKKYVVEWMKTSESFTKEEIRSFDVANDKWLPMTACSLVMAQRAGMPFREQHTTFLNTALREVIARSVAEPVEAGVEPTKAAEVYKPTIQDRLNERTCEIIGELEGIFDEVATGVKKPSKLYDFLVSNNVVQSQLGKYEELYNKRKAELVAAQGKEDAQLKEGYSHLKAADFKRIIAWIDDLLSAVDQYRGVKKATKKARVRKAPSKEKVVAKLKYAKNFPALKAVSINPADIVGASTLWVYNTKTRKLGKYIAGSYTSLGVKGTTITNFDVDKSVSKTLRKPEETLKEFAKAGKIQLRKFLDEIKATEVKLTGRISEDIILLKIE